MGLFDLNIKFNHGKSDDIWNIDHNINNNFISIDKQDYFLRYVNPNIAGSRKNKGGNSIVYFLYNAQDYDQDNPVPDKVIKISNNPDNLINNKVFPIKANIKFKNEVIALDICKNKKFPNIIIIESSGYVENKNVKGKLYPFYIMEYAQSDLKNFIDNNPINLEQKISFCYDIACGLKQLIDIGIYHRDLKPDNIFFVERQWKIGDLGLIDYRDKEIVDTSKSIIGPKGWLSPEAMNKYLTNDLNRNHPFDCKIDHQSDIFQLGKVFWYIIQGNAPIGCVRTIDFVENDIEIYALLRTMLNHSKRKRYKHIDEVINILKRLNSKLFYSALDAKI